MNDLQIRLFLELHYWASGRSLTQWQRHYVKLVQAALQA